MSLLLTKAALIIFVRNPVLGHVKTRIAKDTGDEIALDVYQKLLAHTHSITHNLDVDVFVFYADYINDEDLWNESTYQKRLQSGNDLGERMRAAFISLTSDGYTNICIIGSDCLDLTQNIIQDAFAALATKDAVIGPSYDGGYYLLGMRKFIIEVFEHKNWSSETVLKDTIIDLEKQQCSYFLLPTLSDIDTIEDCKRYPTLLT